jgi:L-asparaginase
MHTVNRGPDGAPRVAIASLGGTITMTPAPDGIVLPTLSAVDLIDAVPGIGAVARLATTTLATLPSASLSFADVLGTLDWARAAVLDGAAGAVLVQGTDTIEETAYLLDLHWDRPEPLVVTGAMRAPGAPGADGPANILAAVRTAVSPSSRSRGCLVVLNDEIHAAGQVRKSDATGLDAFDSPSFGPAGRLREGEVVYGGRSARWPHLPRPDIDSATEPRVALIETCLADDGGLLRAAMTAGYDGVVVGGFGAGHVSRSFADVLGEVTRKAPVVLASRTGRGATLRRTYGFAGSESDLLHRGAIGAGWLDPRKARILLWSLLAARADRETVALEFARRGDGPGGPQ